MVITNSEGWGLSKGDSFKGKYETALEFLEGHRRVDISKTTQLGKLHSD